MKISRWKRATAPHAPGRFRAQRLHDGREGIRDRGIHQMNCFDDALCLWRMSIWMRFLAGEALRSCCWLVGCSPGRVCREKFEDCFLRCLGLIGEKQVAGAIEEDEFCSGNAPGDELAVAGRNEGIGFSVEDEGGRGDLCDAAVGFPGEDAQQLCHCLLYTSRCV